MVLNLMRVEEINPEYMLERSFHQFQIMQGAASRCAAVPVIYNPEAPSPCSLAISSDCWCRCPPNIPCLPLLGGAALPELEVKLAKLLQDYDAIVIQDEALVDEYYQVISPLLPLILCCSLLTLLALQ